MKIMFWGFEFWKLTSLRGRVDKFLGRPGSQQYVVVARIYIDEQVNIWSGITQAQTMQIIELSNQLGANCTTVILC